MLFVCLDLEGVLVPEIWIGVAETTGIDDFRLTTRDIADYDELMGHRLKLLDTHKLGLADIQSVINDMSPLPGALQFIDSIRARYQLIILSDTFYEFARPLVAQLAWPTLLCHRLLVSDTGRVTGYRLRQKDQKAKAVNALSSLNLKVIAAGDSYNDVSMLAAADRGIFFRPPPSIVTDYPGYPVVHEYRDLEAAIDRAALELPLD